MEVHKAVGNWVFSPSAVFSTKHVQEVCMFVCMSVSMSKCSERLEEWENI